MFSSNPEFSMAESREFYLSREKTLGFLRELEAADVAKSLFIPAGSSIAETGRLLETHRFRLSDEVAKRAAASNRGAAVFEEAGRTILIAPPFPIAGEHFVSGFDSKPLRSLIEQDRRVAVILVRLGNYAIGLFDGVAMINSKVGSGLVHGRHKKGGSSQQRFRRHREKQIEYFLTRICGHIEENLLPYATSIDHIAYGGATTTIRSLREHCSFLNRCTWDELPSLLDIPNPDRAVLEKSIRRLWCSRVIEWDISDEL